MGHLADSKQATQIGTGLKLCRSWNSGGRHTARSPRLRLQLSPRLGPFVLRRLIGLGLQYGQIDHIARQVLGGYFGVRQLGEFRHFSQSILGCFHHNGKAALLDLGMRPGFKTGHGRFQITPLEGSKQGQYPRGPQPWTEYPEMGLSTARSNISAAAPGSEDNCPLMIGPSILTPRCGLAKSRSRA